MVPVSDGEGDAQILLDQQARHTLPQEPQHLDDLRTIFGARPSDGSSSTRIAGLSMKARAIESICCSPPESW